MWTNRTWSYGDFPWRKFLIRKQSTQKLKLDNQLDFSIHFSGSIVTSRFYLCTSNRWISLSSMSAFCSLWNRNKCFWKFLLKLQLLIFNSSNNFYSIYITESYMLDEKNKKESRNSRKYSSKRDFVVYAMTLLLWKFSLASHIRENEVSKGEYRYIISLFNITSATKDNSVGFQSQYQEIQQYQSRLNHRERHFVHNTFSGEEIFDSWRTHMEIKFDRFRLNSLKYISLLVNIAVKAYIGSLVSSTGIKLKFGFNAWKRYERRKARFSSSVMFLLRSLD